PGRPLLRLALLARHDAAVLAFLVRAGLAVRRSGEGEDQHRAAHDAIVRGDRAPRKFTRATAIVFAECATSEASCSWTTCACCARRRRSTGTSTCRPRTWPTSRRGS